jgi:hypothetical protein
MRFPLIYSLTGLQKSFQVFFTEAIHILRKEKHENQAGTWLKIHAYVHPVVIFGMYTDVIK